MDKLATSMWLALRAIGFADVRYGIPASAVGFRPPAGPGMTADWVSDKELPLDFAIIDS